MKHSFDHLLGVLDCFLPPELVVPEMWANIRKTASRLVPIYHGGLECRLSPDRRQVDLHQCIRHDQGEPELLIEHIQQSGWKQHAAWKQIEQICRQWRRPSSSLHRCVAEIWLEFDIHHHIGDAPIPSIFLQLRPPESSSLIIDELIADVLTALDPVAPRCALQTLQTALKRCSDRCPAEACISHIGLMLARKQDLVRINIKGLSAQQWPHFFHDIGWPGSASRFAELVDPLYDRLEQLVFCLDVGRRTAPGVGLECLVESGSNRRGAWADFLEGLTDSGMCSPEKSNAIIDWEKIIKPPNTPQLWPENLIMEALLRGPDRFSLISQAINHIKIVYDPVRPPEAKAYLWFGHIWAKKEDIESSLFKPEPGSAVEETDES